MGNALDGWLSFKRLRNDVYPYYPVTNRVKNKARLLPTQVGVSVSRKTHQPSLKGVHSTGELRQAGRAPMMLTYHTLARMLVYGTKNIPPRRFFEDFAKDMRPELKGIIRNCINVTKGKTRGGKMNFQVYFNATLCKNLALKLMRQWLLEGTYYMAKCPNAPKTVAKKSKDFSQKWRTKKGDIGSAIFKPPLVDTGEFVKKGLTGVLVPV